MEKEIGIGAIRNTTQAGMTLVEIIVALAVLATTLMAMVGILVNSMRTDEQTREYDLAKQAATAKLGEIRAHNFDNIFADYNGGIFQVEGLKNADGTNTPARGSIVVDNFNVNLLEVEITISWLGINGVQNPRRFKTMVTR
ncbi:MAG: hypothetical protein A2W23_04715 [Planctomycetes bacterium RBG_16_43_13]|nr:MAG: hypothetical protein A2W23_04715 [Planctomycetes bacterium RBG_16_43_13]